MRRLGKLLVAAAALWAATVGGRVAWALLSHEQPGGSEITATLVAAAVGALGLHQVGGHAAQQNGEQNGTQHGEEFSITHPISRCISSMLGWMTCDWLSRLRQVPIRCRVL